MMENQHRKIKGYRELSKEEIDLMNKIKEFGPQLESLVNDLESLGCDTGNHAGQCDRRWVSIGKTHLQQGLMALVRSVAKPESF